MNNKEDDERHHSFHVFDGDAFLMFGNCQETYQHCIMRSEGIGNEGCRASIVFKKSLPLANGRRGHGVSQNAAVVVEAVGKEEQGGERVPYVRRKNVKISPEAGKVGRGGSRVAAKQAKNTKR